jgi:hypothetical protein
MQILAYAAQTSLHQGGADFTNEAPNSSLLIF